ncbi:MAG: GNAT family N-acetyltransferase [Oscillospiraceae bacterium]|nr:GNAT family N-acetyltransferase [Oscillospiraceae bacterium]
MNQLKMWKFDMSDIPKANIPPKYELRVIRPDEKEKWEELCLAAFKEKNSFHDRIECAKGYVEDGVFVISHGDKVIATGTALCGSEFASEGACVHMIAADAGYSGQKLGYEITAATLRRIREAGFGKAFLTTDDFRLPAIKTYRSLGFVPDLSVDETMSERWEKIYKIFGWELLENNKKRLTL